MRLDSGSIHHPETVADDAVPTGDEQLKSIGSVRTSYPEFEHDMQLDTCFMTFGTYNNQ